MQRGAERTSLGPASCIRPSNYGFLGAGTAVLAGALAAGAGALATGAGALGAGAGAGDFAAGAFAAGVSYWPEGLEGTRLYEPVPRGLELRIGDKLAELRRLQAEALASDRPQD